MKRVIWAGVPLCMLLAGCATEKYVRQQTEPLNDRLESFEKKIDLLDVKVCQCVGKNDFSPADRQALEEARSMSKLALDEAKQTTSMMKGAMLSCMQAEAAVKKAEEAAKRSEEAADKAGRAEKKR